PETDTHAEYEHEGLTFRNQPVAWWLDYLRRFADTEAPWIICQTRIDEIPDRGEHPQVPAIRESAADVTTVAYSAKTQAREGLFFGALSDAVRAVNPPKIGRGRLRVIEDLRRLFDEDRKREKEDRTCRLLSRARFDEICAEVGGISDTGHFLDFLHRSGEVFWQDGLFGGDIVLDQPWMLEAIYAVFDRSGALQTLRLTGGRFTRADMGRLVWDVDGYSVEEQEQFIRFMGTCQIAFRLSDDYVELDKAVYLAPDLLPETWGLRDAIDPRDPVARSFRFEALPPALMRHVQSRLGKAARDSATYWRNGFYGFDTGSGTHLMFEQILDTDWSGTITVTAWGREARRLSETGTAILEQEARSLGLASDVKSDHAKPEQGNEHKPDWGRDPEAPKTLAVSYAWKDEADPDRERIVDGICAKAETAGWKVIRDKTSMTTGDRISDFMEAIGQATRVLVVLTEKYTRSRFCMSELRLLWLKAGGDERVLREKVRVYSDDVVLRWNDLDRADVVSHWETWVAERKSRQRQMAVSDIQTFRNLEAFCYDAAEILHMFSDTLQPRSLSELADYALD
ncbi:MAG: COR domain-containing protein, partial [Pseudomonadota bacterium]